MSEKSEKTETFVENAKKVIKRKEGNPLQDRKDKFTVEFGELQNKYKLKLYPIMDFVEYKQIPADIQLALLVLNKHTVAYIFDLIESEGSNDDNKS